MIVPRILVVDDEAIIASAIQQDLRFNGFPDVDVAWNGKQAVEKTDIFHPDIILMDINLNSSIDGIETAKIIQGRNQVPVIFISGNSDSATMMRMKGMQKIGYLHKPLDMKKLIEMISQSVPGKGRRSR
ncbi:response regulator [bacterium]|nr:response regulator [bacterium]